MKVRHPQEMWLGSSSDCQEARGRRAQVAKAACGCWKDPGRDQSREAWGALMVAGADAGRRLGTWAAATSLCLGGGHG